MCAIPATRDGRELSKAVTLVTARGRRRLAAAGSVYNSSGPFACVSSAKRPWTVRPRGFQTIVAHKTTVLTIHALRFVSKEKKSKSPTAHPTNGDGTVMGARCLPSARTIRRKKSNVSARPSPAPLSPASSPGGTSEVAVCRESRPYTSPAASMDHASSACRVARSGVGFEHLFLFFAVGWEISRCSSSDGTVGFCRRVVKGRRVAYDCGRSGSRGSRQHAVVVDRPSKNPSCVEHKGRMPCT